MSRASFLFEPRARIVSVAFKEHFHAPNHFIFIAADPGNFNLPC